VSAQANQNSEAEFFLKLGEQKFIPVFEAEEVSDNV
jgi:hypothetical protein